MNWIELLNAFRNTIAIPILRDSIVTVNGQYKDKDGFPVEMSSDSHTICLELADDFSKYSVRVKVDRVNNITATVIIENVGNFLFPVTGKDENFLGRVNITPCLSKFRQDEKSLSELKQIYEWINRVCSETILIKN